MCFCLPNWSSGRADFGACVRIAHFRKEKPINMSADSNDKPSHTFPPRSTNANSKLLKIVGTASVAIIGLYIACMVLTDVAARSRSFTRFSMAWGRNWPFARGQYAPLRLAPILLATGLVRPVRVELEPRISLLLNPFDVIDNAVLATGSHDPDVWKWTKSHLVPGGTIIDVGAHIGIFSLQGAKAVGENGKVIAVEPNPATVARLRDNISASGWHNIIVEPVACADTAGTMKLFLGSKVNAGTASLSREGALHHAAVGDSVDVQVIPLDNIVQRVGLTRIDVMKVDTEGAEVVVLKGARTSIAKFRPVIIVEVMDPQLRDMGTSLAVLESLLREYGYTKARADSDNQEWIPAR
jgi:FkbM family methyltransferase